MWMDEEIKWLEEVRVRINIDEYLFRLIFSVFVLGIMLDIFLIVF